MNVRVKREPRTYEPDGRHSFLLDTVRAQLLQDEESLERLARHKREDDVDGSHDAPTPVQRAAMEAAGLEFASAPSTEQRVNPSVQLGFGGEYAPPVWYPELYASASRAGRPFGDLLPNIPLPEKVQSINLPRLTTASIAGNQDDGGVVPSQDLATTSNTSQVVTITGELDISQQLLDLTPAGFDTLIWPDLNRAYNKALELQLVTGTGSGELLGLANIVQSANSISGTGGSTVTALWPLLGQAAAAVGNNRLLPPEVWLIAPRRWFWLASALDNSNRPISSPGSMGAHIETYPNAPEAGGARPFGPILGLPAYLDGAIAAGTSADAAYCVRPNDSFLFEGQAKIMSAFNPLSTTLQARLQYRRYVAFVGNRYPSGIGVVTSIPQPNGF